VELDEYHRMAEVEDDMWFYRALHGHLERELVRTLQDSGPGSLTSAKRASPNQGLASIRVLDAGCGTGGFIRRLEKNHPNWTVTGIDLEPLACELAKNRGASHIVEGSLLNLPFTKNSFAAVVCSDVLYHLDDDEKALLELRRVLQPGGVLVVNVPAYPWLWSYHDVTVHGRRRYTQSGLAAKLRSAGFYVEQSTHWNALPLPLVVVRRKLLPPPRSRSDVQRFPRPVEALFRFGSATERWWLTTVGPLPFGSSILTTARVPTG